MRGRQGAQPQPQPPAPSVAAGIPVPRPLGVAWASPLPGDVYGPAPIRVLNCPDSAVPSLRSPGGSHAGARVTADSARLSRLSSPYSFPRVGLACRKVLGFLSSAS